MCYRGDPVVLGLQVPTCTFANLGRPLEYRCHLPQARLCGCPVHRLDHLPCAHCSLACGTWQNGTQITPHQHRAEVMMLCMQAIGRLADACGRYDYGDTHVLLSPSHAAVRHVISDNSEPGDYPLLRITEFWHCHEHTARHMQTSSLMSPCRETRISPR